MRRELEWILDLKDSEIKKLKKEVKAVHEMSMALNSKLTTVRNIVTN